MIETLIVGTPGRESRALSPPRDRSMAAQGINTVEGAHGDSIRFGGLEFTADCAGRPRYDLAFRPNKAIRPDQAIRPLQEPRVCG